MAMAYRNGWESEIAQMRRVLAGLGMNEDCKALNLAAKKLEPEGRWSPLRRRRSRTKEEVVAWSEPHQQVLLKELLERPEIPD